MESTISACCRLSLSIIGQMQRQLHILNCIENGNKIVELEDETDGVGTPGRKLRLR